MVRNQGGGSGVEEELTTRRSIAGHGGNNDFFQEADGALRGLSLFVRVAASFVHQPGVSLVPLSLLRLRAY
jgi:hypothetical protein